MLKKKVFRKQPKKLKVISAIALQTVLIKVLLGSFFEQLQISLGTTVFKIDLLKKNLVEPNLDKVVSTDQFPKRNCPHCDTAAASCLFQQVLQYGGEYANM